MIKYLSILFLFISTYGIVDGQALSGPETVRNYSIAQKRLLVISTFQFADFISQNNLDKDSIMAIACHITGMPFLLPYHEGITGKASGGEDLINAGKIAEAKQLLKNMDGEKRIQLLIELAIWYLHQPGSHKSDLDSANFYIAASSQLTTTGKYPIWENECRLLTAELYYQRGNMTNCKNTFIQLISSAQKKGNKEMMARAYHQLGVLLPFRDSMKLVYYQTSFQLYQQLQLKEKEIEVQINISRCEENISMNLMEKHLEQALSMMQSTKFKHVLYVQNLLTFALVNQSNYIDALRYAKTAIKNMKWSGIGAVAGAFYYRIGGVYEGFRKYNEASSWFKKAMDAGTSSTHLFWYKNIFFAHALFIHINKPAESLSMINGVTGKFPPLTLWEKMEVFACKGECYEKLGKAQQANENYMALLEIANNNPLADPDGELCYTYLDIASFYISQKDLKKALSFLKLSVVNLFDEPYANANKYSLLFKIDSSRGNFQSALQIHMLYKLYYDSLTTITQQKKMDELTVKYATEKKDQDIKLLKQQGIIQQAKIKQNKIAKNIMMAGTALLFIIVGLLFSQYRLKQRTNAVIIKKNRALEQLVEQKEWLLKEVHHRVKNNLQIIISLLNTQSNYLDTDAAIKAIRESQERMHAISLIHQKLYKSEDTAFINIKEYVHELVEHIRKGFSASSGIVFDLNISDSQMDVAQAVPLGLILNEAISNAIKYAFPNGRAGFIRISLTQSPEDDNYFLVIADNGVGMPKGYDISKKASLGVRLMHGFAKQLGGHLNIENIDGVKIQVSFQDSSISKLVRKKGPVVISELV